MNETTDQTTWSRPKASGVAVVTCEFPPFPGGIGTYAGELAAVMGQRGFSVTVVAPSYQGVVPDEKGIDVRRILGHHRIRAQAVPALVSTLRLLPQNQPILAADIRSVVALYILRPFHRRQYRAMVHGSEAAKFQGWSVPLQLARMAYTAASMVLFNSRATQEIFERGFGKVRNPQVTYLGVDEFWFGPVSEKFENSDLEAISEADHIVCSVGRVEPRKGQLEAVRILALVAGKHRLGNLTYVIAGRVESNEYMSEILEEAKRLSVRVLAPGSLSRADIKLLFRRALCQVLFASSLPGKIEGFGLVLLEAAAQECPTIATNSGGIPEVLGNTGLLVPEGAMEQAADGIHNFAIDPIARKEHGEAARRRAMEFTWSRCADLTFPELANNYLIPA